MNIASCSQVQYTEVHTIGRVTTQQAEKNTVPVDGFKCNLNSVTLHLLLIKKAICFISNENMKVITGSRKRSWMHPLVYTVNRQAWVKSLYRQLNKWIYVTSALHLDKAAPYNVLKATFVIDVPVQRLAAKRRSPRCARVCRECLTKSWQPCSRTVWKRGETWQSAPKAPCWLPSSTSWRNWRQLQMTTKGAGGCFRLPLEAALSSSLRRWRQLSTPAKGGLGSFQLSLRQFEDLAKRRRRQLYLPVCELETALNSSWRR